MRTKRTTARKLGSGAIPTDPRLSWRDGRQTGGLTSGATDPARPTGASARADDAGRAGARGDEAGAGHAEVRPPGFTDAPRLRHRRDGILPAIAAALSVQGTTLTCAGSKADSPPELHPLVAEFLAQLPAEQRERTAGRCPEPILLSRFLTAADAARTGRAARKPFSHGDARKALRDARLTARRIREDGDPEHGSYAPPCRACTPLLAHFGVHVVDPGTERS